jgi:hypothetical protein
VIPNPYHASPKLLTLRRLQVKLKRSVKRNDFFAGEYIRQIKSFTLMSSYNGTTHVRELRWRIRTTLGASKYLRKTILSAEVALFYSVGIIITLLQLKNKEGTQMIAIVSVFLTVQFPALHFIRQLLHGRNLLRKKREVYV